MSETERQYIPQLDELGIDASTKFPLLRRAPIVEALVDIRTVLPESMRLEDLEPFQSPIRDRFPERQRRKSVKAQLNLGEHGVEVMSNHGELDGFFFRSAAEKWIVQARLDGFTLSKLAPYSSWQEVSALAKDLWRLYVSVAKPTKITRLAVRYINKIELPFGELKEHVFTAPDVARGLPQVLPEFLMRLVLPYPSGAIAIINEAVGEREPGADTYPLIFDIDVYREVDMGASQDEIWRQLEDLRMYKNRIFFNSLTAKTLEGLS